MSFPRYERYKDGGVGWLGEVPEHWDIYRSRRLFAQRKERVRDSDEQLTASQKHGIVTQEAFMQAEGRAVVRVIHGAEILKHVEPDDFVISMRSFQGGLEWSGIRGCISSAYVMLAPSASVYPGFFRHLFKSDLYIQALQTTSNLVRDGQAMRYENFTLIDLPLPPMREQRNAASFLDHETKKIEELIAEQCRLIELLKEKREAVVSHSVIEGLNPNALMKDTGIDGLGQVPGGWVPMTVTRVIDRIEQGWSPECFARQADIDEWGVVKSGCVNRGVFAETENKALPAELAPNPEYEIKSGDVLMSRASGSPELVGSTALVCQTRPRLMLSDKIFRIRLDESIKKEFFVALFNSSVMRSQIERAISGAGGLANNLPQSALKSFWFALPPTREQEAIAAFIAEQTGKIDTLLNEAKISIELLKELRSVLISATVTGKIDVRKHTPTEAA